MGHGKRKTWSLSKRYNFLLSRGKKCENCLCPIPISKIENKFYCIMELDHVVPLSRSGPDSLENLCVLCLNCHRHKFLKEILEKNKGLYCLRHDCYYTDNKTHGVHCFKKENQLTPFIKTIEDFSFRRECVPEVKDIQTGTYADIVKGVELSCRP